MKRILVIGLLACSVSLDTDAAILSVAPQIEILDELSIQAIYCDLDIVASYEISVPCVKVKVLKSDYSTPSFSVRMKGDVFPNGLEGVRTNKLNRQFFTNTLKYRRARDGLSRS